VLYFENYVVTEPGLTPLSRYQLMSEEEYLEAQDEYGADSVHRHDRRRGDPRDAGDRSICRSLRHAAAREDGPKPRVN
jgi:hypothetical protein